MNAPRLDNLPAMATTTGRWICHTGSSSARPSATTGHDLASATELLDATIRLHACSDPQTLLHAIATEALGIATADGVAVLLQDGKGPPSVLHLPRTDEPDLAATTRCLRQTAGRLPDPCHIPDLDHRLRVRRAASPGDDGRCWPERWRSLLVADLDSANTSRPARLLWYAETTDAFTLCAELAVLFAGHAALAVRNVGLRHHLERAIDGRTVTGQATGILMDRYRLTAERSFEILRRCSQDRNVKLRDVAEALILTGELPR